jgi:hypothetical protein
MSDAVMYWNEALLEINARDHTTVPPGKPVPTRGPTGSSRAFAIVHLAIYDAVALTTGKPSYTGVTYNGPFTPEATEAAIAAAAQTALTSLFPEHAGYVAAHTAARPMPFGPGQQEGHQLGGKIAATLLAKRAGDAAFAGSAYGFSPAYGQHRTDPVNPGQGIHAPHWGEVPHFVLPPGHVGLAPPPGNGTMNYLASQHYKRDHDEVRSLGGLQSTSRTPAQTTIGVYWAYDGVPGIGTPPRLFNQFIREIAVQKKNDLEQNAELFALANAAMADAAIEAWHWKYQYNLWRPVIGIREACPANGPSGIPGDIGDDCDPFWLPLGAPLSNQVLEPDFTPPFPAYPSGHATFGAAVFQVIRLFYNDTKPITVADVLQEDPPSEAGFTFSVVSDEMNGSTTDSAGRVRVRHDRKFTDLVTPIRENALSRVYLGVHWRFDGIPREANDNIGGVPLGLAIGKQVMEIGLGRSAMPEESEQAKKR